ncbi:hypothetical protein CRE_02357 [Caenorhabditis remanei]|uniref:T-box domain-containing protein n=1 Tax=Caenorhabditis remanei TaxID=31234 RepID=E3MIR2_CAERE|nr:hypothetical protein CRE_02357 [Caenorhabditis remanei]
MGEIGRDGGYGAVERGRELLQRGLKLEKLKLTNSKDALQKSDQMIRVQSMRQYVPVLNIYEATPTGATVHVGRFPFVEAKFIAVTAYQSEQVKCLKVQKNKFAQGFRESVKAPPTSTKRPHSTVSANSSPDSTLSDGSEISVKKGRSDVYQAPPTPTTNQYYQFQTVQNFQPSFQQNFGHHHGFDTAAGYWNPPPLQYDFTMGHSNMYGYQWNA